MGKEAFIALIDKYLKGQASQEEQEALINYYQSFQETGNTWDEQLLGPKEVVEERLLARFRKDSGSDGLQQDPDQTGGPEDRPEGRIRSFRWRPLVIAAGTVGILLVGGLLLRDRIHSYLNPAPKDLVIETRSGERKLVLLSDSSRLWLEPETRLTYPDHFDGAERRVRLEGSAFFDVAKDKEHPFVIWSNNLRTEVLGTTFNIHSGSFGTQVSVVTGQVSVRLDENNRNGREITLSPNQQALYSADSGTLVEKDISNAADYLLRREGKYNYRGEKVRIVLDDLARCFKNRIEISGGIANCAFFGSFATNGEKLGKIMELIAASLNAKVIRNEADNSYTLSGPSCQ